MRTAPFLIATMLLLVARTAESARQPAISAGRCVLTPGDRSQGVDRKPGDGASWQAKLPPLTS